MTTQATPDHNNGLLLPGLDGTNPLGFLAALGVFRMIASSNHPGQMRLRWTSANGTWVPALIGSDLNQDSLPQLLMDKLSKTIEEHPTRILKDLDVEDPTSRFDLFQQYTEGACAKSRADTDWLAALASNIIPSSAINQLQTTRRDYFYGNLTSVINRTKTDHLRRAIFAPWDYADPLDNQSLHLEPSEDRRHAHQWNKPAGDPDRKTSGGMLGANRLAIEAFALFSSLPSGDALSTIGFTGQRSYNTRWTWPIWNVPLSLSVVWSLLMLPELQDEEVKSDAYERIRHRGIVAVFRTSRILVGKTPNFTPAQRIA
jgi:CRISPR-associated endonuclease/helicase Cas3